MTGDDGPRPGIRWSLCASVTIVILLITTVPAGGLGESEDSNRYGTPPPIVPLMGLPRTNHEVDSASFLFENFTSYFDYYSMTEYLEYLSVEYSDLMFLYSLGETFEGRDIWCAKLSDRPTTKDDGGIPGSEPDVLLVGAHHGNEWISYEVPLYILTWLLVNYGGDDDNGSAASYLLNEREIFIVPMLNADGVQYSHDSGSSWRKNREPNYLSQKGIGPFPDPDMIPASYGTDINRNYGWMWHLGGGSNVIMGSGSSYRGPPDNKDDDGDAIVQIDLRHGLVPLGPDEGVDEDPWDGVDNDGDGKVDEDPAGGFSSSESTAMEKMGERHRFPVLITYHSYSELILWPWGYTPEPTDDAELMETLGVRMSELNGYRPIQGYELYMTTGEMTDWFYSQYGTLGYTFEIAKTHRVPTEVIIGQCQRNLEPTLYLCHAAANPYESYIRFDENGTLMKRVKGGIEISSMPQEDRYPFPWDMGGCEVVYRVNEGAWKSGPLEVNEEGNWTALIPVRDPEVEVDFYLRRVDSAGRVVLEPAYAPYQAYRYSPSVGSIWGLYMGFDTVLVMLFTLGIIWGGFVGGIGKALRSKKGRDA